MPVSPDAPVTIEDLLHARLDARIVTSEQISWATDGTQARVQVGGLDMPIIVIDDPNFPDAFVAPIRGQNYLVSPSLM